jgi:glutamate synthase (NADPH/NADH) large chain
MWEPQTITSLQQAARGNDQNAYWEFSKKSNEVI